ncbi:hypothetical protein L3X38_003694 [Prunus dulcis]|uniref:Uncharacterized protein n=1 Tax=Prunus dulcis TaxID=3755 RepID=A0AAD4ZMH7_PRUDU|nr:hypothetical protein L3X38_003694 [Prunus dulcis]
MVTLRAAVMWTVNDFSAYAMVSGWSTKGYMACPYNARDSSLIRRGIACWSCQLSLDVANRKASQRAEKKCTQ